MWSSVKFDSSRVETGTGKGQFKKGTNRKSALIRGRRTPPPPTRGCHAMYWIHVWDDFRLSCGYPAVPLSMEGDSIGSSVSVAIVTRLWSTLRMVLYGVIELVSYYSQESSLLPVKPDRDGAATLCVKPPVIGIAAFALHFTAFCLPHGPAHLQELSSHCMDCMPFYAPLNHIGTFQWCAISTTRYNPTLVCSRLRFQDVLTWRDVDRVPHMASRQRRVVTLFTLTMCSHVVLRQKWIVTWHDVDNGLSRSFTLAPLFWWR